MEFNVSTEIIEWRGPAPFYFIPIKKTTWTTAVFPKDGRYLVPIKEVVRKELGVECGDSVKMKVKLGKEK